MSYLGIQMGEAIRDDLVGGSEVYARFDAEKQVYFKWIKKPLTPYLKLYLKINNIQKLTFYIGLNNLWLLILNFNQTIPWCVQA